MSFTESNFRAGKRGSRAAQLSTDEWEATIGAQFRSLRIRAQLDQFGLAELAGISVGAVKGLEQGRGSSLKTIVCVALALDRAQWLEAISPPITVSPIAILQSGRAARTRVYRPREKKP
jgi:transcriptional regulator with XRE-family HTH domain